MCTLTLTQGAVRVNNDASQAPAICAAQGSDSTLVAHEDCDKFYKCYRGKPVAISCPKPLLYNPEKEWCDWPENVDCNRPVMKEDSGSSNSAESGNYNAQEICAAANSEDVLIPHEVCSKFYKCFSGSPVALDCPTHLVYNIELEYCDWPENVDCENRS